MWLSYARLNNTKKLNRIIVWLKLDSCGSQRENIMSDVDVPWLDACVNATCLLTRPECAVSRSSTTVENRDYNSIIGRPRSRDHRARLRNAVEGHMPTTRDHVTKHRVPHGVWRRRVRVSERPAHWTNSFTVSTRFRFRVCRTSTCLCMRLLISRLQPSDYVGFMWTCIRAHVQNAIATATVSSTGRLKQHVLSRTRVHAWRTERKTMISSRGTYTYIYKYKYKSRCSAWSSACTRLVRLVDVVFVLKNTYCFFETRIRRH